MATAQQQSRPAPAPTKAAPQQVQQQTPLTEQMLTTFQVVRRDLKASTQQLTGMLPDALKGQAERFIKVAEMTFRRNPDLERDCPPAEFIRCVLHAASTGLAIDGKLAYVVRYKSTWQFQADYKGLVAVGKLWGVIRDCYGDVVCVGDEFEAWRDGPESHLKHRRCLDGKRGEVRAAYALVIEPSGHWRYELMDRDELDQIQRLAPAKNGPWGSPFGTVVNQMRIKTVIRRAMKLYQTDPAVAACLASMDDPEELENLVGVHAAGDPPLSGRHSFRGNGHGAAVLPGSEEPNPPPAEPTEAESRAAEAAREMLAELTARLSLAETHADIDAADAEAIRQRNVIGDHGWVAYTCAREDRRQQLAGAVREPGDE